MTGQSHLETTKIDEKAQNGHLGSEPTALATGPDYHLLAILTQRGWVTDPAGLFTERKSICDCPGVNDPTS